MLIDFYSFHIFVKLTYFLSPSNHVFSQILVVKTSSFSGNKQFRLADIDKDRREIEQKAKERKLQTSLSPISMGLLSVVSV